MNSRPSSPRSNSAASAWIVPFVAVICGMMALQMSSLGFSPLLPDIQSQFRIDYTQVGLFTGLYGIIGILLSYPAGLLARRFGERTVLLTGLCIVAAGLSILALAPNFTLALSGRVVWLCGYRLAFVCVMIAVALTAPPRLKGSTMGILGAIGALASVVGAPFGSAIGRAIGWRGGIAGFAAMTILGALIFGSFYRKTAAPESIDLHRGLRPQSSSRQRAYRVPAVWAMAAGVGLLNMGGFTITFFVPVIAKGVFHLGSMDAAYMISSAYFAAIFVNLLVGYLADRLDRTNVMIALGLLLIVSATGLLSTKLVIFRLATIALVAFGHSATNQSYAVIGSAMKGRETGPAMGIVSLGAGVYAYAGPQMIGILRDRTGHFIAGNYLLIGASCLGALIMIFLKMNELRTRNTVAGSQGIGAVQ